MKKALIFGVSGFAGEYLAKELISNGYDVSGSDVTEFNADIDIDFHIADLLNYEEVEKIILNVKPDMIFNLAAISSVGVSWNNPQATMSVNVTGAINILEASRKCSLIPQIMLVGSSEEYASSDIPIDESFPLNCNSPYGVSKMAQEKIAEIYRDKYGMKIYCVRPFNHTGVGQKDNFALPSFCKQVAEIEKNGKSGKVMVGNLSAIRDFTDVRDVVRAYRMIAESGNCEKIYNIGTGKGYSLKELLDYIISLCSQDVEVVVSADRYRKVDVPYSCCNSRLLQNELGWKPEHDIIEALKELFEYYLNN